MAQIYVNGILLEAQITERTSCARVRLVARLINNRINELREKRGWTWAQLAAAIRPPCDTSTVYRLANGQSPLTSEWMERLSETFGLTDPLQILRTSPSASAMIPLVGYVGAGEMYYPDPEAGLWAPIGEVEGPPGVDNVVAVRVRGDSMAPVYRNGDLVYFRRDTPHDESAVLNRDCVVQLRDGGPCYVKQLRRGARKGTYTLESYTPSVLPIMDIRAEWIAPVEWVKRA